MKSVVKSSRRSYASHIFKLLLWITFALFAIHLSLQYLNWEVFYQQNGQIYELTNRFDLDDEASVPTWFSQLLFLLVGLGALLASYMQHKPKARRLWQLIALIGVLFSIDEIAGLHEFVLQTIHVLFFKDAGPTEMDNAWLIVLPFILLGGIWLLWNLYKVIPKRTLLLIAGAGVIFLSGAIGVDLFTSITERESYLNQGILTGLEEAMELLSVTVVIYAITDYLERYHNERIKLILKNLTLLKR